MNDNSFTIEVSKKKNVYIKEEEIQELQEKNKEEIDYYNIKETWENEEKYSILFVLHLLTFKTPSCELNLKDLSHYAR